MSKKFANHLLVELLAKPGNSQLAVQILSELLMCSCDPNAHKLADNSQPSNFQPSNPQPSNAQSSNSQSNISQSNISQSTISRPQITAHEEMPLWEKTLNHDVQISALKRRMPGLEDKIDRINGATGDCEGRVAALEEKLKALSTTVDLPERGKEDEDEEV